MVQTPAFFSTQQAALGNASIPSSLHPNLTVLPAVPRFFIDVNSSFGESNDELVIEDAAIKKQIINILSTPLSSDDFEPEYGSNLPFRLLDPVLPSTAWMIENDTIESVNRWMAKRISLARGDCYVQPLDVGQGDIEGYYIRLKYSILRTRAVTTWQFSVYK